MSESRQRVMAAILGAAFIVTGHGCGGEKKVPRTTTTTPAPPPAPSTSVAPAPPTTLPPPAAPNAAATPAKPRLLPTVSIEQGGDLVAISNWRWKDDTKRQMVGDVRLTKGPIGWVAYAFYGSSKDAMTSGQLPGSLFPAGGGAGTIELPPAGGIGRSGKPEVADIATADRLVLAVYPLPQAVLPPGQPAWAVSLATACQQGSTADCQKLASAYRTGKSEQGAVTPDAALAKRFSEQMIQTGGLNCSSGQPDACFVVGRAYVAGEGVAPDADRGIAFIQKACALGGQAACDWQAANPQPR